jgi:uncharacterized protein
MPGYQKPLPAIHPETQPFWEGLRRHEILIPRCQKCDKFFFYPRSICPYCLSDEIEWVKVSGRGKIYSFTVSYRPGHPAFVPDIPYNIAVIELEEGVRMMTNIVGNGNEDLRVDLPVEAVFDDVIPQITLLKFKLLIG